MITFLRGTVVDKQPTRVVLDVAGVGYEVFIPLSSYDRLPPEGEACTILTHDYIREDTHQLFGFSSDAERRLFTQLLAISGIGPRLALSALSGLSVRELRAAVVDGDVRRLSTISGLGKKTAERIVVELRHKMGEADALEAVAGAEAGTEAARGSRDAVMALIALGYKQADAQKMVAAATRGAVQPLSVEEVIRKALAG
jgi:Holliday junction DNA helicase RuvA